jgi:SMC interacting uncharacterized protein involved in chromosome segregation
MSDDRDYIQRKSVVTEWEQLVAENEKMRAENERLNKLFEKGERVVEKCLRRLAKENQQLKAQLQSVTKSHQLEEHCEHSGVKLDKPKYRIVQCPYCNSKNAPHKCSFCEGSGIIKIFIIPNPFFGV